MQTRLFLNGLVMAGLILAGVSAAGAVTIDFDTDADYDSNFVELLNPGTTSRDAGGYLLKSEDNNNVTVAVFNEGATGGTAGSGGTTFDSPRDTFGGATAFTVQADMLFTGSDNNGDSLGFYLKIPDANNAGYAVIFRGGSNADVRFFDSSNISAGGVGSIGQDSEFTDSLASDTWYTAKVLVEDVGSDVKLTASLFNQGGAQIGSSHSWTDTSSALTGAGQVGLRLGSNAGTLQVDNFAISIIPEPASLALMGLGSLLMLGRARQR